MFNNRVGEIFTSSQGDVIRIIECFNSKDCTIIFNEKHIVYNKTYGNIKIGKVNNPYSKNVNNIGFLGEGVYKSAKRDGKITNIYRKWVSMIKRCYDDKFQDHYPTYIGCSVIESWHNFQNFAKWMENNYNPETMQNWHLDKDILVKSNKTYSPETCCFVPEEINNLFTIRQNNRGNYPIGVRCIKDRISSRICLGEKGQKHLGYFKTRELAFEVYKEAKESYIREVADKWKSEISENVYEAMYNYRV